MGLRLGAQSSWGHGCHSSALHPGSSASPAPGNDTNLSSLGQSGHCRLPPRLLWRAGRRAALPVRCAECGRKPGCWARPPPLRAPRAVWLIPRSLPQAGPALGLQVTSRGQSSCLGREVSFLPGSPRAVAPGRCCAGKVSVPCRSVPRVSQWLFPGYEGSHLQATCHVPLGQPVVEVSGTVASQVGSQLCTPSTGCP